LVSRKVYTAFPLFPHPLIIPRAGFKGGLWGTALKGALETINQLMTNNGVKLTLSKAKEAKGALILVEAAGKQASFHYGGSTYSKAFDGNGLHGRTWTVADAKTDLIEKAFVFVPATPRADPTNKKSREAGAEVRCCILVHEFTHAAGLDNDEHTLEDVFCYPAEIDVGKTAAGDRVKPWGGLGKPMPPYTIIAKTVTNLKKAWP
jgi:hypothetical protein